MWSHFSFLFRPSCYSGHRSTYGGPVHWTNRVQGAAILWRDQASNVSGANMLSFIFLYLDTVTKAKSFFDQVLVHISRKQSLFALSDEKASRAREPQNVSRYMAFFLIFNFHLILLTQPSSGRRGTVCSLHVSVFCSIWSTWNKQYYCTSCMGCSYMHHRLLPPLPPHLPSPTVREYGALSCSRT